MNKLIRISGLLAAFSFTVNVSFGDASEAGETCFKCHSQKHFSYHDKNADEEIKGLMPKRMILNPEEYYSSVHKNFSCTDCHSGDFKKYPHPEELKSEVHFSCIDCHGGDPAYSKFSFEAVNSDYRKSIHHNLENKGFSCWNCHDPHSYRIVARESKNIKETVQYNNGICLNCHSDGDRFGIYTEKPPSDISRKHRWLPEQSLHFESVRCTDCHAERNEKTLVSHLIVNKENAVRNCSDCHSENSTAMISLITLWSKDEDLSDYSKEEALSALSLTGSREYPFINKLSIILLIAVLLMIGIHILFRTVRR